MSPLSRGMKAIFQGPGLVGVVIPVLIAIVQQTAFAMAWDPAANYNPKTGGTPYFYSSYPGPPAWFWILVFPGIVGAFVFPLATNWLNNSYKEANAKLRNRQG